jgi:hypothetical protein
MVGSTESRHGHEVGKAVACQFAVSICSWSLVSVIVVAFKVVGV